MDQKLREFDKIQNWLYILYFLYCNKQQIAVNIGIGQIALTPGLRPSRGTNLNVYALPN